MMVVIARDDENDGCSVDGDYDEEEDSHDDDDTNNDDDDVK